MKSIVIAMPLALLAAPALAENVALDCYLETERGRQDWTVNLNEGSRTVTFAHEYGEATHPAVFKQSEVRWAFGDLKIDRETLQFTRRNVVGERDYGTDTGLCRISHATPTFKPASETKVAVKEG